MNMAAPDRMGHAEIMLVDDISSSLMLLSHILKKNGFGVRTADSGEMALASIKMKAPDLVLLDVMMPGLDGFEVCRMLKLDPDTEKIPVIFLTALNDIGNFTSGFGAGGADFITKPFQMEEVLLRINRQLETLYLRRALEASNLSLTESQILLRASIECQKDTILFSMDANYAYLYFNKAHKDVMKFAYGRDIELGMNILSCITSDEDRIVAKENYDLALSGRSHSNIRVYGDIHSACYESFFNPILDAENRIIGATGLARDITERKREEEAFRVVSMRQNAILAAVPDIIMEVDENRVYTWANPSGITFFGDDVIGTDASGYFEGEQETDRIVQPIFDGNEEVLYVESLQRRKDGAKRLLAWNCRVLKDASGKVTGALSSAIDITERMNAEEALHQRLAEMEAIHTVTTALRIAKTRDDALPIMLDETLAALGTNAGAIYLYHPGRNELDNAISRGWFRQLSDITIKPGEGIVGEVFSAGKAHVSEVFWSGPANHQKIAPEGWSGICLPLRTDEIMVGTLVVALPPPHRITREQVALLESLAEIAGAALHRMSLYEETVRQLDRLEALHSIDIAITANMDLRMTLNLLLDQVKTQLDVDATRVFLLDPHAQILEYAAGRGFRTKLTQNRIRLGGDFAGRAALERRTIQIDNAAYSRMSPQLTAFWSGEGFSTYFGVPLIAKGQVKGVLEVYHRTSIHPDPDWFRFLEILAGQAAIAIDSTQLFENLQRSNEELALAYDTTIEGWSRALDLRDKETEGHTLRVTEMTLRLEKARGISDSELVNVRRGTLLHDIGKMGVPDEILLKPGELSKEEWILMRKHPQLAFDLLSPISYLKAALDIPYCHHEKWDGSGYPRGLKGEQIPFAARIFSIVDVWDALRSDRPYRAAWSEDKAVEHIKSLSGTHFDPQVVTMFLESGIIGKIH